MCFTISCKQKKDKFTINIEKLLEDNVKLPSIWNMDNDQYKYIIYIDSLRLSSIEHNHMAWYPLIMYTQKSNKNLVYCFIFNKVNKLKNKSLEDNLNQMGVIFKLDSLSIFEQKNPNIKLNRNFHTLLISPNKKVKLIGDPTENYKIEQLFFKLIERNIIN